MILFGKHRLWHGVKNEDVLVIAVSSISHTLDMDLAIHGVLSNGRRQINKSMGNRKHNVQ